jgi:pimeloyl-ACP methyl ester carboxylesterase
MRRTLPAPPLLEWGEGAPALLLHGLGASSHVFEALRTCLPTGRRCVAVDLPHCGRAGAWAEDFTPRALAARLAELSGALQLVDATVVGHSFGGLVALELAALGVTRRVLLLAAPVAGVDGLRAATGSGLARWTLRVAAHVEPSAAAVRAWLGMLWGEGTAPTAGMVQGYLHALSAGGHAVAMARGLEAVANWSLPSVPRGCRVELLVGARDPLVTVDQGRAFARESGARLQILEGVGHCIPEEAPERVAALLRRVPESGEGQGGVLTQLPCNGLE